MGFLDKKGICILDLFPGIKVNLKVNEVLIPDVLIIKQYGSSILCKVKDGSLCCFSNDEITQFSVTDSVSIEMIEKRIFKNNDSETS